MTSAAEPIHTNRLLLRTYEQADAEALLSHYSDPEVCRYLLHSAWNQKDADVAVMKRMKRNHLATGALALVVEHEHRIIGNVEAWMVGDSPGLVELGWTFSPAETGRGFATEAVGALIDVVFASSDVHRVTAQMDARNNASARLAERVGLRQEAHFRENWWCKGEWTDTLVFAMLREEHSAR